MFSFGIRTLRPAVISSTKGQLRHIVGNTGYAYRQSIERGRSQYRTRNLITAGLLGSGCLGIYYYVINSVEQEDFSDIPMPPKQDPNETINNKNNNDQ